MSTLREIAANHARMAKAQEAASTGLSEQSLQIVGGFELPSRELPSREQRHEVPLHLVAAVQDNQAGPSAAYLL